MNRVVFAETYEMEYCASIMKAVGTRAPVGNTAMIEKLEWPAGLVRADLQARLIHVWEAPLDLDRGVQDKLRATLSVEELARAARFRFDEHRRRFIAGRGILRDILGRYLSVQPQAIEFSYSTFGKPSLADQTISEHVRFNLSHAGGLALFAFALNIELGIDVEEIRPGPADLKIAERFFSTLEVAALRALPANMQRGAFFNCWTRKEAYVKALGGGLQIPLDSFDVSVAPDEPATLRLGEKEGQKNIWSLRALHPASGYAAALVAEGDDWELRCMHWVPAAGDL